MVNQEEEGSFVPLPNKCNHTNTRTTNSFPPVVVWFPSRILVLVLRLVNLT